jgi:hypothetical protein
MKGVRIFALLWVSSFYGQGWIPAGSRSRAIADASVTFSDVWAYHHNPAGLAHLNKASIGIAYENRFLLKELQTQSAAFALPLKKGVISFGFQRFGYSQFSSAKSGLGYSLKLSDMLSLGVQLNMHHIRLGQGYGSAFKATGEAGLLATIKPGWDVGFSVVNLTRTKLSEYQEDRLTTALRLGTSYRFSSKLILCVEGEKHIEFPMRTKVGLEYSPTDPLCFRAGLGTQPFEMNAGFGYTFKTFFSFDFGSSYTQSLGWSPNLSFSYAFK